MNNKQNRIRKKEIKKVLDVGFSMDFVLMNIAFQCYFRFYLSLSSHTLFSLSFVFFSLSLSLFLSLSLSLSLSCSLSFFSLSVRSLSSLRNCVDCISQLLNSTKRTICEKCKKKTTLIFNKKKLLQKLKTLF